MHEVRVSVNLETHAKGLVMRCSRCGNFLAVEEPVEARRFFASLKAFIHIHEACFAGKTADGYQEEPATALHRADSLRR
jgi:hypothetical protein